MLAVPGLLPGWEEVDVGAVLESAFGVPVLVDNDANLSAFCEARVGAGAGIEDFVYVNASDGVGAGIVEGERFAVGLPDWQGRSAIFRWTRSDRSANAEIAVA